MLRGVDSGLFTDFLNDPMSARLCLTPSTVSVIMILVSFPYGFGRGGLFPGAVTAAIRRAAKGTNRT